MILRNSCRLENTVRIDDFNFGCLFSKFDKLDLIIKLVRAMLLEKHIILIKENVPDIAIIM